MLEKITAIFRDRSRGETIPDDTRFSVAACVLLLEVAHSDDDFSLVERNEVTRILKERFELDRSEVDELLETADHERRSAVDLFQFSQTINKEFPEPEKIAIMETLWRVVYADGVVDDQEEYLMGKLSALLDLSHGKMIDAKLKVKGELGIE